MVFDRRRSMFQIWVDFIMGYYIYVPPPPPVEDQIYIGAKRSIFPEEALKAEIADGMNCAICLSSRAMRFF